MACIEKIYSVSALIGSSACNGNCTFCAATELRAQAPKDENQVTRLGTQALNYYNQELYWRNYKAAIKLSARYGGWSLSLTSSGEPTCDPAAVTKALEVYQTCAQEGAYFPNVNLFTNGILLGNDDFCKRWLPEWKALGLTNIAVSIHSTIPQEQAAVYEIPYYPEFARIFKNIQNYGIGIRATVLLRKHGIDDAKKYKEAIQQIIKDGCHNITAWPVGNADNSRNEFTPSRMGLWSMRWWLKRNAKLCHGHIWGGGVYDYNGVILRFTDYVTKHDPNKDYVRQLVVFQDGLVAYSWIREGALCII